MTSIARSVLLLVGVILIANGVQGSDDWLLLVLGAASLGVFVSLMEPVGNRHG